MAFCFASGLTDIKYSWMNICSSGIKTLTTLTPCLLVLLQFECIFLYQKYRALRCMLLLLLPAWVLLIVLESPKTGGQTMYVCSCLWSKPNPLTSNGLPPMPSFSKLNLNIFGFVCHNLSVASEFFKPTIAAQLPNTCASISLQNWLGLGNAVFLYLCFRLIFVGWFLLLSYTKIFKIRFTTRHVSSVSLSEPSKSWSLAPYPAPRASPTSYHILRHDCISLATNAKRTGSMTWCCLSGTVNLHVIKSTHLHFLFLPKRKT